MWTSSSSPTQSVVSLCTETTTSSRSEALLEDLSWQVRRTCHDIVRVDRVRRKRGPQSRRRGSLLDDTPSNSDKIVRVGRRNNPAVFRAASSIGGGLAESMQVEQTKRHFWEETPAGLIVLVATRLILACGI